jgi:multiple sugar transport system ATP-binding protein
VTTIYVTHDQTEAMTMGDRVIVMRHGLLQQIDRPQVLYDRPANLFVAEFIGSPSMNLVMADLARDNGGLVARFGDQQLRVRDETLRDRTALGGYEGKRVALGVRPEDIEDATVAGGAPDGSRLRVNVDIREDMGAEVLVHFGVEGDPVGGEEVAEALEEAAVEAIAERSRRSGIPFIARVDRLTQAREGEPIELVVDAKHLHFFDPATGRGIYGK